YRRPCRLRRHSPIIAPHTPRPRYRPIQPAANPAKTLDYSVLSEYSESTGVSHGHHHPSAAHSNSNPRAPPQAPPMARPGPPPLVGKNLGAHPPHPLAHPLPLLLLPQPL